MILHIIEAGVYVVFASLIVVLSIWIFKIYVKK